jgi:uncharacterized membrane protein
VKPKQQKIPFPATASVWLLAVMAGINFALSEWFMAFGFSLLGIIMLALIYLSEPVT